MKVFGVSINYEEIEIDDEAEYRLAVGAGAVGEYLDTQLSDLREGGTVIMDGERVIDPYGYGNDDLLELLAPVLMHVPLGAVQNWYMKTYEERLKPHYGPLEIHSPYCPARYDPAASCDHGCTARKPTASDAQARAAGLAVGGSMPGDRSGLNVALALGTHKPHYGVTASDATDERAMHYCTDNDRTACGKFAGMAYQFTTDPAAVTCRPCLGALSAPCHCSETGGSDCPRHGSDT